MHSIDLDQERLIVKCPTAGHDFLTALFINLVSTGHTYPAEYNGSIITEGGSADIFLSYGVKSPDYSWYEENSESDEIECSYPNIVWEVAFSEPEKKLDRDAARHLCLSSSRVNLVIAVNIESSPASAQPPRELQRMTWEFWECTGMERVDAWVGGENLVYPVPANASHAKEYCSVSKDDAGQLMKYTAKVTKTFKVSYHLLLRANLTLYP